MNISVADLAKMFRDPEAINAFNERKLPSKKIPKNYVEEARRLAEHRQAKMLKYAQE